MNSEKNAVRQLDKATWCSNGCAYSPHGNTDTDVSPRGQTHMEEERHTTGTHGANTHCVHLMETQLLLLQFQRDSHGHKYKNFHLTGMFRFCSPLLKPLYQYCLGQVVILLEMRDTSHAEAPYWEPQVLQWTHLNGVAPSKRWGTSYSLEGLHFYFYIFILSLCCCSTVKVPNLPFMLFPSPLQVRSFTLSSLHYYIKEIQSV